MLKPPASLRFRPPKPSSLICNAFGARRGRSSTYERWDETRQYKRDKLNESPRALIVFTDASRQLILGEPYVPCRNSYRAVTSSAPLFAVIVPHNATMTGVASKLYCGAFQSNTLAVLLRLVGGSSRNRISTILGMHDGPISSVHRVNQRCVIITRAFVMAHRIA